MTLDPRPAGADDPAAGRDHITPAPASSGAGAATAARTSSAPLVRLDGIGKRYGGVVALDGVTAEFGAGEVHALLGENGAGKSTLIGILTGDVPPDTGTIRLSGEEVRFASPADAQRRGISAVYQELSVLPDLDVAENILVGREPRRGRLLLDRGALHRRAARILRDLGMEEIDPALPVGALSVGDRQRVEIARAVARAAAILVLDEPTSALSAPDARRLVALVETLAARGHAVLYVSHRLDEVFRLAHRITVLRDGRTVWSGPAGTATRNEIVGHMLGPAVAAEYRAATAGSVRGGARRAEAEPGGPTAPAGAPAALALRGLTRRDRFRNVDLAVAPGEIVGLAGLVGSGRSSLLETVFGVDRPDAGEILVDGAAVTIRSPRDAVRAGLGFVGPERGSDSLATRLDALRNLLAVRLPSRGGLVRPRAGRALATTAAGRVSYAGGLDRRVTFLSGGNQQKVALGRWLVTPPRILLCDEPTRGIDVGAKAEIHRLLRELAAAGMAVVVASSEIDELVAIADRIVVMYQGLVMTTLSGAGATEAAILRAATGIDGDEAAAG